MYFCLCVCVSCFMLSAYGSVCDLYCMLVAVCVVCVAHSRCVVCGFVGCAWVCPELPSVFCVYL